MLGRRKRERGIALLLSLLVLTILIVLIAQMSVTSAQNRAISQNYLYDLQNSYGARSGYNQALLYLQADLEKGNPADTLRAKWASPISLTVGRATVTVTIEDSERKININLIQKNDRSTDPTIVNQLKRLVAVLGHDPEVALRIADYIRADSKSDLVPNARHARLYNLDELLRIDGITREILYGGEINGQKRKGLAEFVTIWPSPQTQGTPGGAPSQSTQPEGTPPQGATIITTTGKVNLNTASVEVLQALSDHVTATLAQEIVAYRITPQGDGSYQDFKNVADLKKVSGMTDEAYADLSSQGTIKSTTFEIRSRSSVGNISRTWIYVVQKPTDVKSPFQFLGSQRMNDFLTVKPPEEPKP